MNLELNVQYETQYPEVPNRKKIKKWVLAVLNNQKKQQAELNIRLVDEKEATALNEQWRNKSEPTNVLSFTYGTVSELHTCFMGDIVICAPVIAREAKDQNKDFEAHWAHMVIHGSLHLLGYDHADSSEADLMESLETRILTNLGFKDPYHTDEK